MNKLIVVIMGPGKEHFARMALESVKNADNIHYWCSNSLEWIFPHKENKCEFHFNEWDEKDPATNGKCRQRYLDHLKTNHPDDWCLVIDEDEVVQNFDQIKKYASLAIPGLYDVHMRHFIGDLGNEDATTPTHVVPRRLFKISEAIKYPEHSHPVLEGEYVANCMQGTIWHLGHLAYEYMKYVVNRYNQHSSDSVIHNQQFLNQWKNMHLFGVYPKKQINPMEIPEIILNEFEIDKDEFYFMQRANLEVKHFAMMKNWLEIVNANPKILDLGCGMGHFGYVATEFNGCEYTGYELSKFAVENTPYKPMGLNIQQKDIVKDEFPKEKFDLIICSDILEHLEEKDLEPVLKKMAKCKAKVIFSIPFVGDPNLEADKTHKIKKEKEEWVKILKKYFKISEAPAHWIFANQLLVGGLK